MERFDFFMGRFSVRHGADACLTAAFCDLTAALPVQGAVATTTNPFRVPIDLFCQRRKRNRVEAIAKRQHVFAGMDDNTRKSPLRDIRGEPLEV